MVIVDFCGHVMRYDQMNVMESVVAAPASTLEIEVPGPRGKGWRRTDSSIDTAEDPELNDEWKKDLSEGARHMQANINTLILLATGWHVASQRKYNWRADAPHLFVGAFFQGALAFSNDIFVKLRTRAGGRFR